MTDQHITEFHFRLANVTDAQAAEIERAIQDLLFGAQVIDCGYEHLDLTEASEVQTQARFLQLITQCEDLLRYRDANTLNFQLEKLDDFLYEIRRIIEAAHEENAL